MKLINHFVFLLILNILNISCLSFTEAYYEKTDWGNFTSKERLSSSECQNILLQNLLFQKFQEKNELECTIVVYDKEYKYVWIKKDYLHYSFISPLDDISSYGLLPINLLAWIGLIPNYQERKINISAKVYSPSVLLWEKEYYNYYETWTSFLFLPFMPIHVYLLGNGDIADKTLYITVQSMVGDFRLRGLLEK